MKVDLATLALALLAAVNVVVTAYIVAHRAWIRTHDRRVAAAFVAARPLVVSFVVADNERDRRSCAAAIAALSSHERTAALELIARALSSIRGTRRRALLDLIEALGMLGEMHRNMGAIRARIRAHACERAGMVGHVTSVPMLTAALSDRRSWVRIEAARALGRCGLPEAAEPLEAALVHDTIPRGALFHALLALGPAGVVVFRRAFDDVSAEVRSVACLGLSLAERDVSYVLDVSRDLARVAIEDDSAHVRASAVRALGILDDDRVRDDVVLVLRDEDARVRREAATTAGRLGHSNPPTSELIALLDDLDRETALRAAEALMHLDVPAAGVAASTWPLEHMRRIREVHAA